ncbi:hypothetical protein CRUP_028569, partial [Coryphaenoides rupestris]
MDLNEISMNLVPFPRLHYVVPSLTPLCSNIPHRRLDHMFSEVFSKDNQLIRADPKRSIVEKVRRAAEHCDCLQCFFLIHSMGGGTGSGLGTRVLGLLEEEFPEVCRVVTSVFPSEEDDVVTSPYNSVLAMKELTEHADCVLPVENQSLVDILAKVSSLSVSGVTADASSRGGRSPRPFDSMNNIIANLLLNLTSLTPLCSNIPHRRLDHMFSEVFSKDNQLIRADPKRSVYLACCLVGRGDLQLSD